MRDERSIKSVPISVTLLLVVSLCGQIFYHSERGVPSPLAEQLPSSPSGDRLRSLSFGEDIALGKLIMLWLQSFDNQPGISIPFVALDYSRVVGWLSTVLALDSTAQYPLLIASRIYADVPDPLRQREMLDFVESEFIKAPNERWQWMAHAVYVAKHRMKDQPLALHYAKSLAEHATGDEVPSWAKQMVIFVLEDMGELESAKVLLGGLLDSGEITDPHEQWFLSQRLAELEAEARAAKDE